MSSIEIYYLIPVQLNKGLRLQNIDLSQILRQGDKTIDEVQSEIKTEPDFCREQDAIEFKFLYSSLNNDLSLYASLDGKVVGVLTFMFTQREGKKYILFNGICSPAKYSGLGVGQELIGTLIRIGKSFDINYINLDCKGDALMNYYKKFGFRVTKTYFAEDSDDEDDEEVAHYKMSLDLSTVSGGKKYRKTKRNRRKKRKNTRRKLRKYH